MTIEVETAMWNPLESEYILLDQWMELVHEFKARGYKEAYTIQRSMEKECGNYCTLYIKVAEPD